ncbi:MAG: COX15/CtaA family protein [Burkholderiales bacterium]|nr:COX15/CtaA family protein [Burkholderiales bacterium]
MDAALPHGAATNRTRRPGIIAAWLLACCALVFCMVVVGGITRLTHSGLSIVEWQPLVGTLPPLGEAAWEETFAKYRLTPEYLQVNKGMTLEEFKGIFWWEYFHRLLGRLIGAAFLLPLVWFWWKGRVDRPLAWKLSGIFVLGGLQGALGWYMVRSGLVDDPRVAHERLAAHLGLAVLIFAAMFWLALELLREARGGAHGQGHRGPYRLALAIVWLVFLQILAGALVAGLRAGHAYNTFPLMNGALAPEGVMMLSPWYLNLLNNPATVQFDHRTLAWLLAVLVIGLWAACMRPRVPRDARAAAHLLLAAFAVQFLLGVYTLLHAVPVALGAAHQAGAMLVFTAALWQAHTLRRNRR